MIRLRIDGTEITVRPGATVAVALANTGRAGGRRSVLGELRGPLCGMGICYECRVTIDGRPHLRSCMVECREGMEVQTDHA